ncbi:MAG: hypothetical protein ABIR79_06850 [Candidatus Binatia bacterium]
MRAQIGWLLAFALSLSSVTPAAAQCPPAPLVGCRKPISSGKSSLMLRDRTTDTRDLLAWKWLKGDATSVAAFGDPTTTTAYALCLYDETAAVPALVQSIAVAPGGLCGGQACWKPRSHGFKYANKAGTPDGVVAVLLNDGGPGTAHISVKATGLNLTPPALPLQQDPKVTLQMQNDLGECWDADYATAQRNESDNFKAKSD